MVRLEAERDAALLKAGLTRADLAERLADLQDRIDAGR